MAFRIFPPVFSALPSPSNVASPVTLPATSLTLPFDLLGRALDSIFVQFVLLRVHVRPSNFSNDEVKEQRVGARFVPMLFQ
jgi:hypothetical protein